MSEADWERAPDNTLSNFWALCHLDRRRAPRRAPSNANGIGRALSPQPLPANLGLAARFQRLGTHRFGSVLGCDTVKPARRARGGPQWGRRSLRSRANVLRAGRVDMKKITTSGWSASILT